MKHEKNIKTSNGYVVLGVLLVVIASMIIGLIVFKNPLFLLLMVVIILLIKGFFIVNPNSSKVLVLFGAYKGTVKDNGFFGRTLFIPDKEFR